MDTTERVAFPTRDADGLAREELANRARRLLYGRFRQAGLNIVEAEDLAQECLVELLERMDRFDEDKGSFDSWLGGFARNGLRAFFRRDASKRRLEWPLEQAVDTEDQRETEFAHNAIEHVLDDLGMIDRELVTMRFALEMSFDDIAKAANLTPVNARKRVSRAVERLRRDPVVREALGLA
ncbi:MAG: sigma-70 family RNA polymerase sigma factor [Armatimonadetes bacterium]|nr:sigma-70 family RNA polymerase sigma factor [Armatimonadota bacterium]